MFGLIVTIILVATIFCSLIAVFAYALVKNPDKGCTYDCENCPFPKCSEIDKELMQSLYGDNNDCVEEED